MLEDVFTCFLGKIAGKAITVSDPVVARVLKKALGKVIKKEVREAFDRKEDLPKNEEKPGRWTKNTKVRFVSRCLGKEGGLQLLIYWEGDVTNYIDRETKQFIIPIRRSTCFAPGSSSPFAEIERKRPTLVTGCCNCPSVDEGDVPPFHPSHRENYNERGTLFSRMAKDDFMY